MCNVHGIIPLPPLEGKSQRFYAEALREHSTFVTMTAVVLSSFSFVCLMLNVDCLKVIVDENIASALLSV